MMFTEERFESTRDRLVAAARVEVINDLIGDGEPFQVLHRTTPRFLAEEMICRVLRHVEEKSAFESDARMAEYVVRMVHAIIRDCAEHRVSVEKVMDDIEGDYVGNKKFRHA